LHHRKSTGVFVFGITELFFEAEVVGEMDVSHGVYFRFAELIQI
jgi:hypothetical protein